MKLDIVIPVYRSEGCLRELLLQIDAALKPCSHINWIVILVDDCSPDNSWLVIQELQSDYPVLAIRHRRNFGQDAAIMTGLRHSDADMVAIMDDDLQHAPKDIPVLLAELERGFDLVYANFPQKNQALWKNTGSYLNGRIAEIMIGKPKHIYLSPYKVFRGELTREIVKYTGPTPYVDGLLFQVTANVSQVDVQHRIRFSGSSNYSFLKSLQVASRLAFSFSIAPLRWAVLITLCVWVVSLVFAAGIAILRILYPENYGEYATGWASLMVTNLFFRGLEISILGMLCEYLGRTLMTVNRTPQAVVSRIILPRKTRDEV